MDVTEEEKWDSIVNYLDKEIKIREQMLLFEKANDSSESEKPAKNSGNSKSISYSVTPAALKCVLCGCSENHVPTITKKGTSIINYFACEAFASSTCTERFEMLKKKKLCFQCLSPGYKAGSLF